ncbi:ATP-dependent helicase [Candidatus Saccharibacteria bacterium]|nr:ATP-dependent helicase [Candidatus Saccharibacteria bacterium]
MPLNSLQQQAVEYLEGPLLVLAGPGTGKTQLLSSKVEYILKTEDTNPENILCLTYTESGASNMRNRLYSMIGQAASKVNIHTYHAFGSDIIAKYKNYATEFDRNLDQPIDEIAQYKIINEIQKSLPTFDILKNARISDILSTISSAKSARLSPSDLAKIAKENIAATEKLNPLLNEILQKCQPRMKFELGLKEVYLPIMETLGKFASNKPLAGNIYNEAGALLFELNSVYEKEAAKEKPSISPLTAWKNSRFELDDNGNYRLKNRIPNLKLQSFASVMQKYEEYLNSAGLFDYADMIEQAIHILKTDRGFKLTLEEQYQYILLDEFQDTNTAQAELIYELSDYEKPVIMAVGDDDQAIYAFQGANASNLLNFQNHYNAKVITLIENYRSFPEILDVSYLVRGQILESFAKKHNIDKKLQAFHHGTGKIFRHEFIEASAEYHWIANQINDLISAGVKQSEIAIITPKHKYVLPILPYLKSYPNIKIAYEKRDNLFEDQKIHELLTLSRFIYELSENKDPAHMLMEVLSFPFFKIDMADVIKIVSEKGSKKPVLDYLLESNNDKIKNLGIFFSELVRVSFNTPIELFLDYLVGSVAIEKDTDTYRSNFLNYYTQENPGYSDFELYENLSVLRSAITSHTASIEKPKLKDLINFVDDYELAGAALVSTSPYQDADDAVQILTAHKSKGLEFEYVFTVATDDLSWGNAKGNNNQLTLPSNLVEIRHTGATEDERLRLFFVAITRAKTELIMTNSIKNFEGKKPAHLAYLQEYEDKDSGNLISPLLPKESRIVKLHYDLLPEDQKKSDLRTYWLSHYQHLDGNLKEILLKRLENYRLTATDLTKFIDIAYAGPMSFYKDQILRAPRESYSQSATFGNLVHATFEQVTNNHLSDEDAIKYFKEQVLSSSIPAEDVEYILEKGEKSLQVSLKAFDKLLRCPGAHAEVNLRSEPISLNGIPLTGKIDHINIDDQNKTIEIYDFKTSGFSDKKWNSHPTLLKYRIQLGFYKLLLNLSPTYSKYKIEKSHILYVVPDSEDKVYDKVYDYNEEDEEELKAIISAVYAQIKSLDFVDNKELFIPPDPEKKLKDIKEFITLLLDAE